MSMFNRLWIVFASAALSLTALSACSASAVPAKDLTGALHWRSVGPYLGGRVTSLGGIPSEPNHYYAAYAGGGIWETVDYGHNWKNITDKYFKNNNIGAIAVARSNPKIIYAGTGDSAPRNTFLTGEGMYKSLDGGKTWSFIGLDKTHIISWILVDPKDADVVYAAALGHFYGPNPERGVFKSADGGKTWKKVLYVDDKTGAITMAMDPSNPQVVYAAMWEAYRRSWTLSSGGPGSGIYKTTDGGAHWTNITRNQGLPTGLVGKIGLAVAPSDPRVVYALIQAETNVPGKPGGLFRSTDAGQTWSLVNDSLDITQRAFYYSRVYVDPKDANTIYLPNAQLFVSHDGGKSLTELHPPHGDNHAFWINPINTKTLIEGNDGGATVSLDGGKTWSSEVNQPTGQFYHANLDNEFPFDIYGAQQDRGSVFSPSAVEAGGIPGVWTTVKGGEASWVVPTPDQPWITYGSGYYSQEWREDRRTGVSTQVPAWGQWNFGVAASELQYRAGWWYHPKVFAPKNPKEFLATANVVFKTLDQGLHWAVISPDLTRNDKSKQARPGGPISADVTGEENFDTISSLAFSPLSDDVIWAGSDDGLVHVTTDGGAHWNEARPSQLPTWSTVTSIEPSHSKDGTVYMTASRFQWDDFHPYVYKTTDGGKHWTVITTGLPDDQYVESVREDPDDPSLLFAGTSATVYMSLDGGDHWQSLALNLPAVRVSDIEIQRDQHAVVLSTFGRAFWVLDDLQFLEQLSSAKVSASAPYLFKPQQTWLVSRRMRGFGAEAASGTGNNLPPGATVFFRLPADYSAKSPVKLSFTDASGKLIRSFTLPEKAAPSDTVAGGAKPQALHAGMNRFLWNMRYPDAVDVKGIYESPHSQGAKPPVGPEVVAGTYYAQLEYAGHTQRQPFTVKLDPRLSTTPAELQQRFDLLMKIHDTLGEMDIALNAAIDARAGVEKALAGKGAAGGEAKQALDSLNRDIDDLVNLRIQSDEGALVYAGKLRARLSWLAGTVDSSFLPPTPSMVEAANTYFAQEKSGVAHLKADTTRAQAVMR